MSTKNLVSFIFLDKFIQFLDGSNDDRSVWIFELFLEDTSTCITIGSSLLKLIVFFHRLVVEIFPIDDEEYLLDI